MLTYFTLAITATVQFFTLLATCYFDSKRSKQKDVTHLEFVNRKRRTDTESVYVAGAWSFRAMLQEKMDVLRNKGFNVTSNWPGRENRLNNPDDYAECSRLDIEEVSTADTVLAIMTDPEYAYRGTFTEIGCAIGTGRRVIVVTDGLCERTSDSNVNFTHYCMQNVFFWDPRIEHASNFEDAIKLMNGETVPSPFKEFYTGNITNGTIGVDARPAASKPIQCDENKPSSINTDVTDTDTDVTDTDVTDTDVTDTNTDANDTNVTNDDVTDTNTSNYI